MRKFLLITTFFLLSSCEDYCIKPKNLLNLHEKLDIVSTQQKWTNSNIHISNEVKVTEIHIVPNKISFCSQYEDIAIRPGTKKITLSKFTLKAGDILNFSIVGSKICKDKENKTIRYINIDKKCNNKEKEYFAHILNQNECQTWENKEDQYTICPNKYIIGNKTKWLNGKEYWNPTFSKLDQDERKERIQNIINSIKEKNVNCDNLLKSQINKVDTHILNLLCGYICKFPSSNRNINCAYTEYNNIGEIFQPNIEVINNTLKEKQVKTYITFLRVHMDGENFEHIPSSGLCTNCNHKINSNHKTPSLIFSLCSRNDESCFNKNDKGGFNIRVTKVPNLENSLYIRVSNEHPKNNPGENQEDISIDISKIHDNQEIEKLKKKLKNKRGTIFYGIKDHGCNYENNKGQLNIKLTTKELHIKTFSAIYNFFDEKIKAAFFGSSYYNNQDVTSDISAIKSLYESFLNSSKTNTIRSTIVSLLVLYIILYTFYYLLGLTHVSIYEFLIVCVKIGIITQLLRNDSWNYFYNNAFSIFINTPKQLIEIANFRNTTSNIFEFLDSPLNRFFSSNSILLIISLIFSGPLGVIAFCLVIWGLIKIVLSTFNALFSFITSITIVALLLSLAPIFIICLLFTYTRQMFYNWIKNLAKFAIHPAILLIFISLISQAMDYIIYSIFDFEACSMCILNIDLKILNPCILYGYVSKYAPNIAAMIAFVILSYTMEALIEASSKISDSLFNTYVMSEPEKQYQQSLMEIVGLSKRSTIQRPDILNKRPEIPQGTRSLTPSQTSAGKPLP